MDAMHAAVKSRRAQKPGLMDERPDETQDEGGNPQSGGGGMAELLAKLSPEQKEELKSLLAEDGGDEQSVEGSAIAKGAASSEEKSKINQKMQEEPNDESDDIQLSMVDRRHADMPEGVKPKSLGERAKMDAAKRLRSKGKI